MKSFSESISTGQSQDSFQDTHITGPSTDTEVCQAFANAMLKKWERTVGSRLKTTMKEEEYKAAQKSIWDRAFKHMNDNLLTTQKMFPAFSFGEFYHKDVGWY